MGVNARIAGRVEGTPGDMLVLRVPGARVGDGVRVHAADGGVIDAVVSALDGRHVLAAPLGALTGVAVGDLAALAPDALRAVLGFALAGRAIDATGRPLDGREPPRGHRLPLRTSAPPPGLRTPVTRPFWTGVRAIDGLLTLGAGARIGLFGAPGAGKSTLLELIAGASRADAIVVALIGERGREAQRWIATLREPAYAAVRTIVCATSDCCAAERIRAAEVAMAQATLLRDRGCDVVLLVDSLARYVGALRERALAFGEPVGRGGYPASVFAHLARYLECAGNGAARPGGATGSLTAIVTVLPDGGDDREPLADAARSLLDGHLVLSTTLASAGRFPAIDIVASASRTMGSVCAPDRLGAAGAVRSALARLGETHDLRAAGIADLEDPALARALAAEHEIEAFLRQRAPSAPHETLRELGRLAARLAA